MDIQQIMDQAKAMQIEMQKMQDKLGEVEVTGEAGGGLVKVTMTCKGQAKKVELDESVVDTSDIDTLQDLIVASINDAKKKADETLADETKKMMTKMGLPSNVDLPF
ncbi:MAG TPA: YbaB/EbfC family nucleoid-associated protein [Rhodospirillaceae bacterium]|nr:YbaB/EbfC family nucleoid-associated protein [Rhodospirillaceae bacterium]